MLTTMMQLQQMCKQVVHSDLFIHEAVEDEDEDALETVEYCEEICHHYRLSVDVEKTKHPRRTKQHYQHDGSFDPRSTNNHYVKMLNSKKKMTSGIYE